MRSRRPLAASYSGLVLIGLLGGVGFGGLSAAMFIDRRLCEPVVSLLLPLLDGGRASIDYNPAHYYFWAGVMGFMALLWIALSIHAIASKPGDDRRLDDAIKAKLISTARGAPLEPK